MAHTVLPLLLAALLAGAAVSAFEPTITPRLIDEALSIGQSRIDSVRTRFHQPYRLQVSRPPIDHVDIVTPYRRASCSQKDGPSWASAASPGAKRPRPWAGSRAWWSSASK